MVSDFMAASQVSQLVDCRLNVEVDGLPLLATTVSFSPKLRRPSSVIAVESEDPRAD
jgi:hypothetical protein